MNVNKIQFPLSTISQILHCSDIHIRNVRRHEEYKIQFNKLYEQFKEYVQLDPNTIICVSGDIAHSKTDMSPELIQMISDFLNSLASIAPTIVTVGNHDANLNNQSRLDVLTPIITNLNNPNIFYLRDTGIYDICGIYFNVMSVLDTKIDYILPTSIDQSKYQIVLFHGLVNNTELDNGIKMESEYTTDMFDGADLVILGDIHKHQILQTYYETDVKKPHIEYASSLIQQNFGEGETGHGFVIWDIKNRTTKFVELSNDSLFHTIIIDNNKITTPIHPNINKRFKVRVKISNSDLSTSNALIGDIKSKYDLSDINVIHMPDKRNLLSAIESVSQSDYDIYDVNVQNKLIRTYITTNKLTLTDEQIKSLLDINLSLNSTISNSQQRNTVWTLKSFEFSNLFSYGENNFIDFSNFTGTNGVFAPNASGKSSIIDAICYCLFDKTSKSSKPEKILNVHKDEFKCRAEIVINNETFYIERTGVRLPKNNMPDKVKTDVNFFTFDDKGNKIILNGEERRITDKIIQDYIGSYEDAILTNMSLQINNSNFIDKSQSEKKDQLASILNLNIYDTLHDAATEQAKDINTTIKNLHKLNLDEERVKLQLGISQNDLALNNELDIEKTLLDKIDKYHSNINELLVEQLPVKAINVLVIQDKRKEANKKVLTLSSNIEYNEDKIKSIKADLLILSNKISTYDIDKINQEINSNENVTTETQLKRAELSTLTKELQRLSNLILQLETHEYDPNCKYCVNNVFVQNAYAAKDRLPIVKENITVLESEIKLLEHSNDKILKWTGLRKEYKTISESITTNQSKIDKLDIEILKDKNSILTFNNDILQYDLQIEEYNKNESIILKNHEIELKVNEIRKKLNSVQSELDVCRNNIIQFKSTQQLFQSKMDDIVNKIDEIKRLYSEYQLYEVYLNITDRNGLPNFLISKLLPKIESEINLILSNIVDFKIKLQLDGQNINSYIMYTNKHWPLELSSGMERFISSVAIRIALNNISTLPKCNFFVMDEGLGVLDPTNLNSIYMLFNHMSSIYKFVIIISHIDSVKDMVDDIIDIDKINGFSSINIR